MDDAMHFLHVVGALGLTAAFGAEAVGLAGLRRARSADEALLWLRSRRWVLLIGPASIGVVLATGIYLTVAEWGADAWILVSLTSLVSLAAIRGVLTGVPMARVTPAVERAAGPLPKELQHDLRSPSPRGFGEGSKPRRCRPFTGQFQAETLELCRRENRQIGQVAQDVDLMATAGRAQASQAEPDAGTGGDGALTSSDQRELAELRRENRRLRQDVEILKRATAIFATATG